MVAERAPLLLSFGGTEAAGTNHGRYAHPPHPQVRRTDRRNRSVAPTCRRRHRHPQSRRAHADCRGMGGSRRRRPRTHSGARQSSACGDRGRSAAAASPLAAPLSGSASAHGIPARQRRRTPTNGSICICVSGVPRCRKRRIASGRRNRMASAAAPGTNRAAPPTGSSWDVTQGFRRLQVRSRKFGCHAAGARSAAAKASGASWSASWPRSSSAG